MQQLSAQDVAIISKCVIFRGLNAADLVPKLEGSVSSFSEGQFLVEEGELVDRLWIILSGTVNVSRFERSGREFLYQQLLPSYMAGGEVACTPRKTSPYGMYAATDCRLWSFPWARLDEPYLSQDLRFSILRNLLTFVSNQNIRKYYKIEALSAKGARERIMMYLTAQALRARSCSFRISMDREEMANYLCLNRSVLSHELKKMESEGLLHFHKNEFTLLGESCPGNIQRH